MPGRIVVVANTPFFNDLRFNYKQEGPYSWDEFTIPISCGFCRELAQSAILEAVADHTKEIAAPDQISLPQ